MIRWLQRLCGIPVHKGWERLDRHGHIRRCIGCGEERTDYVLWVKGTMPQWTETTASGDGSCGDIPELPTRVY